MFVSLFPNWIGQTQPRVVKIDGDNLYLSTASPIELSVRTVNSYLHLETRREDVTDFGR
jgi:hypothetical protein